MRNLSSEFGIKHATLFPQVPYLYLDNPLRQA